MTEFHYLRTLVDIMTCSVCLGTFNNPVTLKCGHVYCKPCIEKTKGVHCPQCKRPFTAEDFLTVYPTKELCEYLQSRLSLEIDNRPSKLKPVIETTEERKVNSHTKALRDEKRDESFQNTVLVSEVDKCPKHHGEEIKFVCVTCLKGLCGYCLYEKAHGGSDHKLENLKDVLQQKDQHIEELSEVVNSLRTSLLRRSNTIHDALMKAASNIKQILGEFREKFFRLLDEYEKKLITSLYEFDPLDTTKDLIERLARLEMSKEENGSKREKGSYAFCAESLHLEDRLRSAISTINAHMENMSFKTIVNAIQLHNDWIVDDMVSQCQLQAKDLQSCVDRCITEHQSLQDNTNDLEITNILDNKGQGYLVSTDGLVALDNRIIVTKECNGKHIRLASISTMNGIETTIALLHSQENGSISLCAFKRNRDFLLSICRNSTLDEFIWDSNVRTTLVAYRKLQNVTHACYNRDGSLWTLTSELGNPMLRYYKRQDLFATDICILPDVSVFYGPVICDPVTSTVLITPRFQKPVTVVSGKHVTSFGVGRSVDVLSMAVSISGRYWLLCQKTEIDSTFILLTDVYGNQMKKWLPQDLHLRGTPLHLASVGEQLIIMLLSKSSDRNNEAVKFVVFDSSLST